MSWWRCELQWNRCGCSGGGYGGGGRFSGIGADEVVVRVWVAMGTAVVGMRVEMAGGRVAGADGGRGAAWRAVTGVSRRVLEEKAGGR